MPQQRGNLYQRHTLFRKNRSIHMSKSMHRKFSDFDMERGVVEISRQVTSNPIMSEDGTSYQVTEKLPKTENSSRRLRVPEAVMKELSNIPLFHSIFQRNIQKFPALISGRFKCLKFSDFDMERGAVAVSRQVTSNPIMSEDGTSYQNSSPLHIKIRKFQSIDFPFPKPTEQC